MQRLCLKLQLGWRNNLHNNKYRNQYTELRVTKRTLNTTHEHTKTMHKWNPTTTLDAIAESSFAKLTFHNINPQAQMLSLGDPQLITWQMIANGSWRPYMCLHTHDLIASSKRTSFSSITWRLRVTIFETHIAFPLELSAAGSLWTLVSVTCCVIFGFLTTLFTWWTFGSSISFSWIFGVGTWTWISFTTSCYWATPHGACTILPTRQPAELLQRLLLSNSTGELPLLHMVSVWHVNKLLFNHFCGYMGNPDLSLWSWNILHMIPNYQPWSLNPNWRFKRRWHHCTIVSENQKDHQEQWSVFNNRPSVIKI